MLRFEFPAHPSKTLSEVALDAREAMAEYGALRRNEEAGQPKFEIASVKMLSELASLTANFIESYRCVLKACEFLQDRTITEKELLKKIQEYGKARLAIGEMLRPEALSSVNISNAIRAYKDEGILTIKETGGIVMDTAVWKQHKRDLKKVIVLRID